MSEPSEKSGTARQQLILLLTALGAVVLGAAYVVNVMDLTGDATPVTVPWGWASIITGAVLVAWSRFIEYAGVRLRAAIGATLGVLVLLQPPPIVSWIAFHGSVISDGPFGPVGSWWWAVPHLVVVGLAVAAFYRAVWRPVKQQKR